MNKQELTARYKQLRRDYWTPQENDTYMSYNYLCILLDNYETLEEAIQEVKNRFYYPLTQDAHDIYVTFLLEAGGEY